ncbi:unnamed protein product [Brassica rapa]|uniref:Uncharacterized protein n=1 Tax=Brassica campestris TaxID=3711 RepID=A0A3P6CNH2_BRACM|nr:unnamed protein product [Brassica rapa]VDD11661.1 unnamed protein product [Brassica rapa]
MYRQDSIVDLTLKVSDLLVPNLDQWDVQKVYDAFTPEDAAYILTIKPKRTEPDSDAWGFTKHGCYTTQSAYRMLANLHERN